MPLNFKKLIAHITRSWDDESSDYIHHLSSAEGFTEDEIRFNRLDKPLAAIKQKMDKNILAAFNLLKPYGIYHHEIKEMVYNKLGLVSSS